VLTWYWKVLIFLGAIIGAKLLWGGTFELFYSNILIIKKKKS